MDKMSEQSIYTKIKNALKLAKAAEVGCTFDRFEAIELLGYIQALEETVGLQRAEFDAQAARIAELERRLSLETERTQELELRLDVYNGNMMDVLQAENERLKAENAALKEAHKKTGNEVLSIVRAAVSGDFPRYLHYEVKCPYGV